MNSNDIARVAHEVERAYVEGMGDNSVPSWEQAPEWMTDSATSGVDFILAHPDCTLDDLHSNWMSNKTSDGWTFSSIFDESRKQHPRLVPYDQLSDSMRMNAVLFMAVVKSLASAQTDSTGHTVLHQQSAEAPPVDHVEPRDEPPDEPPDEPHDALPDHPAAELPDHPAPEPEQDSYRGEDPGETRSDPAPSMDRPRPQPPVKPDPAPALPEGHGTDPRQEEAQPQTHADETGESVPDSHNAESQPESAPETHTEHREGE